jgi:acetoin utilization deacetylase AcuC-like enzyme
MSEDALPSLTLGNSRLTFRYHGMRRTGFLYDERYLLHRTGAGHPESPARLKAIYEGIVSGGLFEKVRLIRAHRPDLTWIETVHPRAYMERLEKACMNGESEFDGPDNQMCRATFQIALLAVGGILETVDLLMSGEIDNAFCAVRPPGHHAEPNYAMGFCYFNNVAIAAKYLQTRWGVQKVAIVDIDVHHGNGTQAIFEADQTVFYYSIHEHPTFAFPGTGREFELGRDQGLGYTKNSIVVPGQGDEIYRFLLERDLVPAVEMFHPEAILVSMGFDALDDDDMADLKVTPEGFAWIMRRIKALADQYCAGRLVSVLEGGYCLERLPELGRDHVAVLLED